MYRPDDMSAAAALPPSARSQRPGTVETSSAGAGLVDGSGGGGGEGGREGEERGVGGVERGLIWVHVAARGGVSRD